MTVGTAFSCSLQRKSRPHDEIKGKIFALGNAGIHYQVLNHQRDPELPDLRLISALRSRRR